MLHDSKRWEHIHILPTSYDLSFDVPSKYWLVLWFSILFLSLPNLSATPCHLIWAIQKNKNKSTPVIMLVYLLWLSCLIPEAVNYIMHCTGVIKSHGPRLRAFLNGTSPPIGCNQGDVTLVPLSGCWRVRTFKWIHTHTHTHNCSDFVSSEVQQSKLYSLYRVLVQTAKMIYHTVYVVRLWYIPNVIGILLFLNILRLTIGVIV